MIEEEDDEDILKKGVSFKSVIKNLFFIALIILGALFIYLPKILPDQITSWTVGFMLICFGTTLIQMQKSPSDPIRQTLTILICKLCGLTKVRNYEKGDFVFNKKGKCDKCDDSLEIKQIYSVRLKKPTEPNKPPEDKKKN